MYKLRWLIQKHKPTGQEVKEYRELWGVSMNEAVHVLKQSTKTLQYYDTDRMEWMNVPSKTEEIK